MDNDDLWHQARVYETDFRQFQLVNDIGGGDLPTNPTSGTPTMILGLLIWAFSNSSIRTLRAVSSICFVYSHRALLNPRRFPRSHSFSLTTHSLARQPLP